MKKFVGYFLGVTLLALTAFASFQGFDDATDRGVFGKIKCSTGLSCTRTGAGLFTMSVSGAALSSPATLTAAEATDSILNLVADEGDDNGDDWALKALASGNSLAFQNNTSGSLVAQLSLGTTGIFTLKNDETIDNSTTDDLVTVASNDSNIVLSLSSPLTTDGDATLRLIADASADNSDEWEIQNDGGTNLLTFSNDVSGTQAVKMSLNSSGVITMSDFESFTNASDVVTLGADDAAAHLVLNGFEASNAILNFVADQSDDSGDEWRFTNSDGGNFVLSNDVSGSHATKLQIDSNGDLYSYRQNQIASTTTAISVTECASTFVSNSADVLTLPEASTALGCRLTFICGTADDFDVNPSDTGAADIILPTGALTPSIGDALRCTDAGAGFVLEAIGNDSWAVISTNLTITDAN